MASQNHAPPALLVLPPGGPAFARPSHRRVLGLREVKDSKPARWGQPNLLDASGGPRGLCHCPLGPPDSPVCGSWSGGGNWGSEEKLLVRGPRRRVLTGALPAAPEVRLQELALVALASQ